MARPTPWRRYLLGFETMNGRSDVAALPAEVGAAARTIPWRSIAIAAAGGPLIACAFLDPRLYPISWISWVPFLWVLRHAESDREAVYAGFAVGFVTDFLGFYWLMYT